MLLAEQRHQRCDLDGISRILAELIHNKDLQKQVDDYFDEDDKENIPEVEKEPEHTNHL